MIRDGSTMESMSPVDPDSYRGEPEAPPARGESAWSYALWAAIAFAVGALVIAKPWTYWLVAVGCLGVLAIVHLTWTLRQRAKRRQG